VKTEDIDQIIADAIAEKKGKKTDDADNSKWHRPKKKSFDTDKMRSVLNYLFIIGFIATIILYFMFPDNKTLFFSVGFGSLALKIVEYLLKFLF